MNAARSTLGREFARVRALTERLVAPLHDGDFRSQPIAEVSPPYWMLGHTSWFFAANVLAAVGRGVEGFPGFDYAFNSYYEGLGPRLPRQRRGQVAEPTTAATRSYRAAVTAAMQQAIVETTDAEFAALAAAAAVGLQHEQQHQELFLTEILQIRWSCPEPLRRAYEQARPAFAAGAAVTAEPLRAVAVQGGVVEIGHRGEGFCWDNELPVHRVFVDDCRLGDRLITNAEWSAFVDDGGYRRPLLWLSNGWQKVQEHGWQAPLYWQCDGGRWQRFSLRGLHPVEPDAPVCHVSFYEADAFARWYGEQFAAWQKARLPRESEWEHAARTHGFSVATANLLDDDVEQSELDVRPARGGAGLRQLAGSAWEWTQSHYEPYPGYRPFAGALMEYNGKFMDNQRVLRGGSFATPRDHARLAYRNFWAADTRFQVSSVRLLAPA